MIRNIPPISDSGAYFGHWKNHCQPIADDVIDAEKNYVYSPISAGRIISTRSIMKKLAEFRLTIWTFLWLPSVMYVRYIIIMQQMRMFVL